MSKQSPDERLEMLSRRIERNALDLQALMERAQLWLARRDAQACLQDVHRCLQIALAEPRLQGETRAMLLSRLYVLESRALAESGAWHAAYAAAERALDARPDDADGLIQRGGARAALGDRQGAFADLNRALELNPRAAQAHLVRAALYFAQGDYLRARADDDRAIGIDRALSEAWNHRAHVQLALNNLDHAESDCRKALQLDPLLADAYLNLGACALARQQPDEAARVLQEGLQHVPEASELTLELGRLHAEQGRLDEALETLDRLLQRSPRHAAGLALRGQVHLRRGDPRAAVNDLESALELNPDDVASYLPCARIYQSAGCRAAALNAVNRALETEPDGEEARALRDELRQELGQDLARDPLVSAAGALEQFAYGQCGPGRVATPAGTARLRLPLLGRKAAPEEIRWSVELNQISAWLESGEATFKAAYLDLRQQPAALVAVRIMPGEYHVVVLQEASLEGVPRPVMAPVRAHQIPAEPDALRDLLLDFLAEGVLSTTGTQLRYAGDA